MLLIAFSFDGDDLTFQMDGPKYRVQEGVVSFSVGGSRMLFLDGLPYAFLVGDCACSQSRQH